MVFHGFDADEEWSEGNDYDSFPIEFNLNCSALQ